MATWSGSIPFTGVLVPNTIVTTNLGGGGLDNAHRAYEPSLLAGTTANTPEQPVATSHEVNPGPQPTFYAIGPGDLIFERIHVLPQTKAFPMVISSQTIPVEVWNAFRRVQQQVSSVVMTGPAGLSIVTPYVLPIVFPPFSSKTFTVRLDAAGAPRADNTILWDFDGLAEPLFHVTGLRLLPFTVSPDWATGIQDTPSWMTDVQRAYDDTEQRIMLRQIPKRRIQYQAVALTSRESGLLLSLIWAWQSRSYGVPLWMDASPLGIDLAAGSVDLTVDTTPMVLTAGVDTVIILTDAFTWFASQVASLTSSTIRLQTPTDKDFFASRSKVIPIQLGRIPDHQPVGRPTNKTSSAQVVFDLQTVIQL
jgi:hypothetical protein